MRRLLLICALCFRWLCRPFVRLAFVVCSTKGRSFVRSFGFCYTFLRSFIRSALLRSVGHSALVRSFHFHFDYDFSSKCRGKTNHYKWFKQVCRRLILFKNFDINGSPRYRRCCCLQWERQSPLPPPHCPRNTALSRTCHKPHWPRHS